MKVVIGGEMQIPYHDPAYVRAFVSFIDHYEPDEVVLIGDFLDAPGPARWNRGTAAEYCSDLERECATGRLILGEIRGTYSGKLGYHIGNHEERIDVYARTKAPAFAGLEALRVSSLLDFKGFGITELPGFYNVAPGVLSTHGHLGKTLSKYGGGTALAAARNRGMSLVCGHSHRHGIIYERFGTKTIFGMETGHGMSVAKAEYIRNGNPNWSAGWGTLETFQGGVHPSVVAFRNGRAVGG